MRILHVGTSSRNIREYTKIHNERNLAKWRKIYL